MGLYLNFKAKEAETGLGARVIKDLTRNIVGKNHHIYRDNFFISIGLFQELLDKKIYACGTTCSNRKFFPEEFELRLSHCTVARHKNFYGSFDK